MGRYIIEGTWIGYRSSQERICHRTVHKASEKALRKWAENTFAIKYEDGTSLLINVRDCKHRERVKDIQGYSSLIKECFYNNVDSVAALCALKGR